MTEFNPFASLIAILEEGGEFVGSIDRPGRLEGDWWLDMTLDGFSTQVLWRDRFGFGLFLDEAAFGDRPSEAFTDASKAAVRLRQLAARYAAVHETAPLTLQDIRQLTGESQEAVAKALETGQAEISRLEVREDAHLSRLKGYIEALGGELEMRVKFPDFEGPLSLGRGA